MQVEIAERKVREAVRTELDLLQPRVRHNQLKEVKPQGVFANGTIQIGTIRTTLVSTNVIRP